METMETMETFRMGGRDKSKHKLAGMTVFETVEGNQIFLKS